MLKEKIKILPNLPGCYIMHDKYNNVIYVGKAKNLKKRVSSYFRGIKTGKTLSLVTNITDFEYIVTNSELESLLLEINLIKKYNPKYNILLKDDKTYPYIELSMNPYPMLRIIRNKNIIRNRDIILFGPYPNVNSARKTVELINRIYPLKKCKTMKKNYCLYYHLDQCLGYCLNKISSSQIIEIKTDITKLLNGDGKLLIDKYTNMMQEESNKQNYEKAMEYKNLIKDITITLDKQIIDTNMSLNADIIGYYFVDNYLSIQILFVRKGRIFDRQREIINDVIDIEDVINRYIISIYNKLSLPKKLVINDNYDLNVLKEYLKTDVVIPQKGDLKKLLELANNNAMIYLNEQIEILKHDNSKREHAILTLQQLLRINKLNRIEIYDNSHLFGSYYVSSMVVFNDFLPNKKEYRKYKLDLSIPNDIKAMEEVIYRRFYRALLEKSILPDLIILDGGIDQLNVAKKVLKSLGLTIHLVSLKKDNKHNTDVLINENKEEITIPKDSPLFLYLAQMQEEAHRFAINYHRNIKSKGSLESIFSNINGLGKKRITALLKKHGSIEAIKSSSIEELSKTIPKNVAIRIKEYFK